MMLSINKLKINKRLTVILNCSTNLIMKDGSRTTKITGWKDLVEYIKSFERYSNYTIFELDDFNIDKLENTMLDIVNRDMYNRPYIILTNNPFVLTGIDGKYVRILENDHVRRMWLPSGSEISYLVIKAFGRTERNEKLSIVKKLNAYMNITDHGKETTESLKLRKELNKHYRGWEPDLAKVDVFLRLTQFKKKCKDIEDKKQSYRNQWALGKGSSIKITNVIWNRAEYILRIAFNEMLENQLMCMEPLSLYDVMEQIWTTPTDQDKQWISQNGVFWDKGMMKFT